MKPSSFQTTIENQFDYIRKQAMEEMKHLEKEQQDVQSLRRNEFTTLLPLLTINS